MAKSDPTQDPEFKRTLRNLLTAPPKTQAEMKVGKKRKAKKHSNKTDSRDAKSR